MAFTKMKARVSGRVQGVGFRFFTQRTAQLLGLTGWVRNNSNGSVSIEAVGSENNIKELLMALQKGPRMGSVDKVEHEEKVSDYNDYSNFDIKY